MTEQATAGTMSITRSAVKSFFLKAWMHIPGGYLCRFWVNKERVTFYKTGFVVIDYGHGTARDAIPCTMISGAMVDLIKEEMRKIGYPKIIRE